MFPILIYNSFRIPSCSIFFSHFVLAGNTYIQITFLASCLLINFQTKCSKFSQKFCLYISVLLILNVMHICQLITVQFRATLKCFYYFSVKFSAWFNTIFFNSYLGVFCSWIQLVVEFEFCHRLSPAGKPCFSIFDSQ